VEPQIKSITYTKELIPIIFILRVAGWSKVYTRNENQFRVIVEGRKNIFF